ncbi:unnamed protein product [Symbiodinium natans]|uniref:Uncharacterized protein n=1 Tax=Symbiodinium natans TaxID=878477 RepID=A0A812H422_9DINO|nr:unnamed protein product [Symbiodinium natans]
MIMGFLTLGAAVLVGAASPDKATQLSEAMAMDACAEGTCALHALQQNTTALPANSTKRKNHTEEPVSAEKKQGLEDEDFIDPEGDLLGGENFAAVKVAAGWSQGGDKVWGSGRGIEDVNGGNVGYYNNGMDAAHARCGGSHCALIVNPPGHRSINQFHIHFVNYAGYGSNLKHKLEQRVCGKSGWRSGGLPCHGKAIFVGGWPNVFSVAMGGGGMRHASVIAWPGSCGHKGTIIELAYGCSIEHQIRGDYNPAYR